MKKAAKILARLLAAAAVVALVYYLFQVGRGHTVYFDNKTITADGQTYQAYYQVQVFVNDESVGKVKEGERGSATTMGQDFRMVLHITPQKDAKKVGSAVSLTLPYNMDGIVLNIPALLGGAPEEVYLEEFIPAAPAADSDEEEVVIDEFEMPME